MKDNPAGVRLERTSWRAMYWPPLQRTNCMVSELVRVRENLLVLATMMIFLKQPQLDRRELNPARKNKKIKANGHSEINKQLLDRCLVIQHNCFGRKSIKAHKLRSVAKLSNSRDQCKFQLSFFFAHTSCLQYLSTKVILIRAKYSLPSFFYGNFQNFQSVVQA